MKIYTKTGDKGTTRLVDGSCVDKFNPRVSAYGSVDTLNAFVGLLISEKTLESYQDLNRIQNHLFRLGSLLACSNSNLRNKLPQLLDEHIQFLETRIDQMTLDLTELKNFILPQGSKASSLAHVCRTLCRQAERETLAAISEEKAEYENVIIYLNRLSDYFFTLARHLNHLENIPDIVWDKDQ